MLKLWIMVVRLLLMMGFFCGKKNRVNRNNRMVMIFIESWVRVRFGVEKQVNVMDIIKFMIDKVIRVISCKWFYYKVMNVVVIIKLVQNFIIQLIGNWGWVLMVFSRLNKGVVFIISVSSINKNIECCNELLFSYLCSVVIWVISFCICFLNMYLVFWLANCI